MPVDCFDSDGPELYKYADWWHKWGWITDKLQRRLLPIFPLDRWPIIQQLEQQWPSITTLSYAGMGNLKLNLTMKV